MIPEWPDNHSGLFFKQQQQQKKTLNLLMALYSLDGWRYCASVIEVFF